MNTVIKLFSTGWRRVPWMNWKTSSGGRWGKNWRSLEPGDDILTTTRMLVSGIFRQLTTFVVVLDVLTKFYEDRECFLLQRKRMMSALIEIVFYWARVITSVWENEPKLKETTVYTCSEHSESVNSMRQNRIGFSYICFWRCQVGMLTPPFFPNVSTSSV